jgi:hypothetical protein
MQEEYAKLGRPDLAVMGERAGICAETARRLLVLGIAPIALINAAALCHELGLELTVQPLLKKVR